MRRYEKLHHIIALLVKVERNSGSIGKTQRNETEKNLCRTFSLIVFSVAYYGALCAFERSEKNHSIPGAF